MNRFHKLSIILVTGSFLAAPNLSAQQETSPRPRGQESDQLQQAAGKISPQQVAQIIVNWKDKPRHAADMMMKKYGPPQEATPQRLIWQDNGPWKRTEVINEEIPHHFPMKHVDVLEQTIYYRVPADKFDDLAEFDGSVMVEKTRGEISARCDKEAANLLAINLAVDIIEGKTTVQKARQEYADQIKALMQGQKTSYTQQLKVNPMTAERARQPGETIIAVGAAAGTQKGQQQQQAPSEQQD